MEDACPRLSCWAVAWSASGGSRCLLWTDQWVCSQGLSENPQALRSRWIQSPTCRKTTKGLCWLQLKAHVVTSLDSEFFVERFVIHPAESVCLSINQSVSPFPVQHFEVSDLCLTAPAQILYWFFYTASSHTRTPWADVIRLYYVLYCNEISEFLILWWVCQHSSY